MKILTNYANWRFRFARRYNSVTGAQAAGMDRVIEYSPKDIAKEHRRRNRKLFRRTKGAGYWLWKPWIVVETLKQMKEDDVLVYSDAGIIFLQPIEPLLQRMEETGQDVMTFLNKDLNFCKEGFWTKRDAFLLLDCHSPEYAETAQCWAGFYLWKKTEFSMEFARQWLHYIQDERLVSDASNQLGRPNYPGFQGHRHDQSVFSLLAKKHGLILHRCPMAGRDSQNARRFPEDRYPQMILNPRLQSPAAEILWAALLPAWCAYIRSPYDGLRELGNLGVVLGRLFWPRDSLPVLRKFIQSRMKKIKRKR